MSVPADIPVGELTSELASIGAPRDSEGRRWSLLTRGRQLSPAETLRDQGVSDFDELMLEPAAAPVEAVLRAGAYGGMGANRVPLSERTRAALPAQPTPLDRLRAVVDAVVRGHSRAQQRPLVGADPGSFTRAGGGSLRDRVRTAWSSACYEQRLDVRIRAPRLGRCVTVAVVSPKGGPGKTTITALLGSLLAHLRRDRVIAVDANPDFGSLGRRLAPGHAVYADDLIAWTLEHERLGVTELDAQLGRGPDGLMIVPAPTDPARARALDEDAYRTLFERLQESAGTLVLDCGTGLDAPPARAALNAADQLVLVTDAEPDTASLVWEAASWLAETAPPVWLVVNKLQRGSLLDLEALECAMASARGIVKLRHHAAAAQQLQASRFSWASAPPDWAIAVRELAALLVADWPSTS